MSLLDRVSPSPGLRRGHLDDRALEALWIDAALAGTDVAHPHLATCAQCHGRFAAFAAWMDGVRTEAVTEADEAFSTERLANQYAHVMRRLEAAEHPARVITFPTVTRPMSHGVTHVHRWVMAAAAAGLIVGVAVGQVTSVRHALLPETTSAELRTTIPPRSDRPDGPIQPASLALPDPDATFMAEVDASLTRNSLSQLRAFDEITPRAPFTEGRR